MKLAKFCISSTRRISTKLLAISESSTKINIRLHLTLTVILFTSAVICKQRLLHGNEISQYLVITANAITLAKTILESPYKVLQDS